MRVKAHETRKTICPTRECRFNPGDFHLTGGVFRFENGEPMTEAKNEIVVYQPNETVRLEVELHDESIWLTQLKIAELFGVQKAAISKHLKNIFETGELQEPSVVSKMETTAADGKRYKTAFYNLDAIIAVGYRVNWVKRVFGVVGLAGIEPATPTLKVSCSTN